MASVPLSIFLTGATGFIGGTILDCLSKTHPDYHIKVLIRRPEDAEKLQSIYRDLEPIIGDLSSLDLLKETAATVDFVIFAAKENATAVHALINGLATQHSASPPEPRLISISGTRSLIDLSAPVTGTADGSKRPWSDIQDIKKILSLPKERFHAGADQSIIAHGVAKGVGSMLVSPGQLWGRGKGQIKTEGAAAAAYYSAVKDRGRAFIVGDGSVAWSWVSIGDLGRAVVLLMDQATSGDIAIRNRVGVNEQGYYFVQAEQVTMRERADAIRERLHLDKVETVSVETVAAIHSFGTIMWGCGATFQADRLRTLGWRPKEFDWRALMEEEPGERA